MAFLSPGAAGSWVYGLDAICWQGHIHYNIGLNRYKCTTTAYRIASHSVQVLGSIALNKYTYPVVSMKRKISQLPGVTLVEVPCTSKLTDSCMNDDLGLKDVAR